MKDLDKNRFDFVTGKSKKKRAMDFVHFQNTARNYYNKRVDQLNSSMFTKRSDFKIPDTPPKKEESTDKADDKKE